MFNEVNQFIKFIFLVLLSSIIESNNLAFADDSTKQCIDIKRYYNKKTNYTFRDALELTGSNTIILVAVSNSGEGNFITLVEGSNHQLLHSFNIDSSLKQMVYLKNKNKFFTVSQDKLVERHIQQFDVIRQYQIPNIVMIQDIEDSEHEVLVLVRDQRAFRFNLTSEEIKKKYPLRMEGQKYPIQNDFVKIITLNNYQLFSRGGQQAIEVYSIDGDLGMPILSFINRDTIQKVNLYNQSDIVGIKGTNLIVIQNHLKDISVWEIYTDKQDSKVKSREKFRQNIENYSPTKIFYMNKNSNHNIVVFYSYGPEENNYFEIFVYQVKINQVNDELSIDLNVEEVWKNNYLIKEDFSLLSFFPQSQRVYGIMNNQHISYELLEEEKNECDQGGYGLIIKYCKIPKILRFRKWDNKVGIFYLKDGNLIIPNTYYHLLEIRNSQMMEIASVRVPPLKFSKLEIRRVFKAQQIQMKKRILNGEQDDNYFDQKQYNITQQSKQLRQLQVQQSPNSQNDKEDLFMWYNEIQYENQSFSIYNLQQGIKQFSLKEYFSEVEYKRYLNKNIVATYQFNDRYIGCIAFFYPDSSNILEVITIEDQKMNNLKMYFQNHNLECYEMDVNLSTVKKFNLSRDNDILSNDRQNIMDCTINQQLNNLICKNNNSELLFWSISDQKFIESKEIFECIETTQIVSHSHFVYMNCINYSTIIQYDIDTNLTKIIATKSSSYLQLIRDGQFLLVSTSQSPGFMIFDVNQKANTPPLFKVEDKKACCQDVHLEYDESNNRVIVMGSDILMKVNLQECMVLDEKGNLTFGFNQCMQCTMDSYISHSSKFTYNYVRSKNQNESLQNKLNPSFLSIGNGTQQYPFTSDLQIIELYLRVEVLKNVLVGFNQVKLRIYIDSTKVNPLSRYFFDWTQEKSIIEVLSYQPQAIYSNQQQKTDYQPKLSTIDLISYKPAYVIIRQKDEIKVKYWNSLYLHYINIICTQCVKSLNISISYMTDLFLNNVQFLTYDGDDDNNLEDIFKETNKLPQTPSNKNEDQQKKIPPLPQTRKVVKESNYTSNLVKYIYPTFFLKKIDNAIIYSLKIENLEIEKPIMNFQSCAKVYLKDLNFNSNIVYSEIIMSAQTYLKLISNNFTNNIFINPTNKTENKSSNNQAKIPIPIDPSVQEKGNKLNRVLQEDLSQQNQMNGNRTIILITFQNFNATNLLIKNNTFRDHLFFQGFIENQQFSIKTTFIFQNISFVENQYDVRRLPKVMFIQILLEVFLVAQHDVYMENISFQENYQSFQENNEAQKQYDSFYIELSMIRMLNLTNVFFKSESIAGLIETKMVNSVYISNFIFNDLFVPNYLLKSASIPTAPIPKAQQSYENQYDINATGQSIDNHQKQNEDDDSFKNRKLILQQQVQNEKNSFKQQRQLAYTDDSEYSFSEDGDGQTFNPTRIFLNSLFKIQETQEISIRNVTISYLHFVNTIVINVYNREKELLFLNISECKFYQLQLTALYHYIQVNLIQILAENSGAKILIKDNKFSNITLFFSQNSEMKSSSSLTIQSLKSRVEMYDIKFMDLFTDSMIGALSLDVGSLIIQRCLFNNNIYGSLKISENETYSQNLGGFILAKVDKIEIINCQFNKSFTTRGAILIKSNQDKIEVDLKQCTFTNIFSFSSPGSALTIDSSQSILNMNVSQCNFTNIVTITSQYTYQLYKSAIYIQKDYSSQSQENLVYFNQIKLVNIVTQYIQTNQQHFYNSFSSSFNSFFFMGQIIDVKASHVTINQDRNSEDLIDFLKFIEGMKLDQFKFINEQEVVEEFIHTPLFFIKQGMITLEYVNYIGNIQDVQSIILNLDQSTQDNVHWLKHKKTLLQTSQSNVSINNLIAQNLITTKLLDISECQSVELKGLNFENVQQILFDDISSSPVEKMNTSAIINLKRIQDILITDLKAKCSCSNTQNVGEQRDDQDDSQRQCYGQLIFISESKFRLENSVISEYYSPIHNGTALSVHNPYDQSFIEGNKFIHFKTENFGGAIYFLVTKYPVVLDYKYSPIDSFSIIDLSISVNVNKNAFIQNAADKGGAIYFENILGYMISRIKFSLAENKFYNNTSQLGSSLFYQNVVPQLDILTNKFKNNLDEIDRATIFSTPHLIKLVQTDEILQLLNLDSKLVQNNKNNEYIADISVASGQKLPLLRFQFYYINNFSLEKKLVSLDLLQINIPSSEIIQLELEQNQAKINLPNQDVNEIDLENQQKSTQDFILRNKDEVKYDVKNNFIEFTNLQFFGSFNKNATLFITSPLITNEDKYSNRIQKNIKFKININFRPCNQFEIITKPDFITNQMTNQLMQCYKCLDNTFAKDQTICSECPLGAICKQERNMNILKGYWRIAKDSYDVIKCNNELSNCKGGDSYGNFLCKEGHIGALCEECDLFGQLWPQSYSRQGIFKCTRCDQQNLSYILIFLSHILTLIISISSIASSSESIKIKTLKAIYKQQRIMKRFPESANNIDQPVNGVKREIDKIQTGANLKILASYFSIMSSMGNFKFSLPRIIPDVSGVVGSPIAISMNALDCFLVNIPFINSMPYIYFSFIIKLIFPFILFFIIIAIMISWNCANKYKFQFHYLNTIFLFLFIYLQPDLVYEAINLISCREIAGEKFMLANVNFKCDQENNKYEFGLVYPIFILLVFIIPLTFLITLVRNKQKLRKIRFQLRWGILYHEYKDQCYYWEFVKISEKLFIILTISIFNSSQNVQLGVLIIILIMYLIYLYKMKPFMQKKDNSMEFLANFTILITIVLISISIQTQIEEYQYIITLSFMIFVNASFILFITTKIYVEQYELFKQKKPLFLLKCPTIAKFLNYLSEKLQRSWRKRTPQTNSSIFLKKSKIRKEKNLSCVQPNTKIQVLSETAINNKIYQGTIIKIQDDNNSENIQNQLYSLSNDKSKLGSYNKDRDEEVEEFNSFGKTSIQQNKDSGIGSVPSLSSSNLDVSDTSIYMKRNKPVPVSEFKARSKHIQMSQNEDISKITRLRSTTSYNSFNLISACNSQEQFGGINSRQSSQLNRTKLISKNHLNIEMPFIKQVPTINYISKNSQNVQEPELSISSASISTSNNNQQPIQY